MFLPKAPAKRRLMMRFWAFFLSYLGLAFVVGRQNVDDRWSAYALAALPALPLVAIIAALAFYLVEEDDEFLRARMIESLLWGLAAVLVISTVWGFLEALADVPRLPLHWLFPAFCLAMGIADLAGRWRYR